jgi:hypothetical protein
MHGSDAIDEFLKQEHNAIESGALPGEEAFQVSAQGL